MVVNNEGPFNITFTNVTAAGTVGLAINEQGQLYANKSAIDIAYEEIEVRQIIEMQLKRILFMFRILKKY